MSVTWQMWFFQMLIIINCLVYISRKPSSTGIQRRWEWFMALFSGATSLHKSQGDTYPPGWQRTGTDGTNKSQHHHDVITFLERNCNATFVFYFMAILKVAFAISYVQVIHSKKKEEKNNVNSFFNEQNKTTNMSSIKADRLLLFCIQKHCNKNIERY